MQLNGIFILSELTGDVAEKIRRINEQYDPRLARYKPPHITLTGSSGAGPIPPFVTAEEMRAKLLPVTSAISPITVNFLAPQRFMQSDIIVLPLDAHGALRKLHDGIITSGLPFARARYTFSPHCTLSLYQTLDAAARRDLLKVRIPDSFVISAIQLYHTRDPQPSTKLLELPLTGEAKRD